jgi:hypothetical protein
VRVVKIASVFLLHLLLWKQVRKDLEGLLVAEKEES